MPLFRKIVALFLALFVCGTLLAAGKGKQKKKDDATATEEKVNEQSKNLSDIPLPIGHEAKGLTLPDFDPDGKLRGRFTAGIARRVDQTHIAFTDLHIVTFNDDQTESAPPSPQPNASPGAHQDLDVSTADSLFDLQQHVLRSTTPGTVKRSDFQITGDTIEFNSESRQATFRGNVKMVITGKLTLPGASATPKEHE